VLYKKIHEALCITSVITDKRNKMLLYTGR
jgi:hypothetical protein